MPHDPSRRLRQLQRILIVIELLGPLRYGATINELLPETRHAHGDFCPRTIRRDLNALEDLGIVERPRPGRWRLSRHSPRARTLHEVAERRAEVTLA